MRYEHRVDSGAGVRIVTGFHRYPGFARLFIEKMRFNPRHDLFGKLATQTETVRAAHAHRSLADSRCVPINSAVRGNGNRFSRHLLQRLAKANMLT